MSTWVLHVDLDQFIVAVELLRRPELRGRPVVVGGAGDPTRRGVVAGASYEVREYGVRSGTPLRTALARCPQAVFLPLDRAVYEAASRQVMAVLAELPGVMEPAGWDEAFLEVVDDDPERFARRLQDDVRRRTGLECSVGIGENKLQAKIGSGLAKPAGVHRLTPATWQAVMAHRPAEALPGIGRRTAARLAELGIGTVGELAAADGAALQAVFGPGTGPWLVRLAQGVDHSAVSATPRVARSHSREVTFDRNVSDPEVVRAEVERLCADVAADLAAQGQVAVRVVVKVRVAPFVTHTHGVPLEHPTGDPALLREAGLQALARFALDRPVRLVGVRAELAPAR